jgi:hypothetical protein
MYGEATWESISVSSIVAYHFPSGSGSAFSFAGKSVCNFHLFD